MHLIVDWLRQALGNWQGWLSGGGVGGLIVIAIGLIERFTERKMPNRWYAALVFAGFFCGANFVAWSSAFQSMKGRESDLRTANGNVAKYQNESVVLKTQLDDLKKSFPPEPPDSLRRRAKRLADGIDEFWDETYASTIPRTNGVPTATGEQAEINKRWNDYLDGRMKLCLSRFGTQITGIPKEMAAKGISMFWLDKFERGNNLRCLYGGSQGSAPSLSGSETEILRALSYRLDAHGMPVEF